MKNIIKNTAVLLVISVVAFVALSFVYEITKAPIEAAEQQAKVEAYQAVYPAADAFGDVANAVSVIKEYNATLTGGTAVDEMYTADKAGEKLGYVLSVTAKGYGGDVTVALGVDLTGKVVGFAPLSHSETPGFGANMENGDVIAQFEGVTAADQLDGITGATYTTNALKAATQAAIDLVKQLEGGAAG